VEILRVRARQDENGARPIDARQTQRLLLGRIRDENLVPLARHHPTLRINSCTPGFIETDMTRSHAVSRGKTPAELGMKTPGTVDSSGD
jgi:hypothetical protein